MSVPSSQPGTYAVLLSPNHPGPVSIGRLGILSLSTGVFVYVGSALGPGGIAARCRHHHRIATRPHWHLDYLRPHCEIIGCWIAYGTERREHAWARALGSLPDVRWPLLGFGSSDCDCPAHLVALPSAPTAATLRALLGDGTWRDPRHLNHNRACSFSYDSGSPA
jgi:Uri superfamily endonuclease